MDLICKTLHEHNNHLWKSIPNDLLYQSSSVLYYVLIIDSWHLQEQILHHCKNQLDKEISLIVPT